MHKLHAELVAELDEEFMNCETEYGFSAATVGTILKRFFNRVVCVERGDSSERHVQADILHAYVEGAEIEDINTGGFGIKSVLIASDVFPSYYRLKEDELPVDEWQWYGILDGNAVVHPDFMTDEEYENCKTAFKGPLYKLEMSKRTRKVK